jgi:hypothetical protein
MQFLAKEKSNPMQKKELWPRLLDTIILMKWPNPWE